MAWVCDRIARVGRRVPPSSLIAWIGVVAAVPSPALVALVAAAPVMLDPLVPSIGLGVVAYVWMLECVVLSTRPRRLDRLIGLPAVYTMHGTLGVAALAAAAAHRLDLPSYGATRATGDVAFWMLLALVAVALVMLAGRLAARVPAIGAIRRTVERAVHREWQVWLHRLLLAATLLVGIHVNLVWYFAMMPAFAVVMNLYTAVAFLWYVAARLRDTAFAAHGRVLAVTPLGGRVTRLEVEAPALAGGWLEGDYLFLRFPGIPGMGAFHPFSMTNRPNECGLLRFAIRADGDFTGLVADRVRPGDRVRLAGPFGRYRRFVETRGCRACRGDGRRAVVVYAGGIGVAPLIPVAAYCAETGHDVTMLYCAHEQAGLIHRDELAAWAARTGSTLAMRVGRFSPDELAAAMRPDAIYLIGGPEAMLRDVRAMLMRRGVAAADIADEPFAW